MHTEIFQMQQQVVRAKVSYIGQRTLAIICTVHSIPYSVLYIRDKRRNKNEQRGHMKFCFQDSYIFSVFYYRIHICRQSLRNIPNFVFY